MIHRNIIEDVVVSLDRAPIDMRTGNKVLYSVDWIADKPSMIGDVNPDWVRRELAWFFAGSNKLEDMEGPVPKLFQACAGVDGRVNSAYGHTLFSGPDSLYDRMINAFMTQGPETRHAVVIISDRDVHHLSRLNGRNDFICTNALNFMIDQDNKLHIIAQMRSMDAVFGYRADYSMWDALMEYILGEMELPFDGQITRGTITFQVANLHVYPRHFEMLADAARHLEEIADAQVWDSFVPDSAQGEDQ